MKTLILDKKEIPIVDCYDVIVIGGGTAGAFAGISSARENLKTLIIEQFGCLGGSATLGLVTPMMPSHMPNYKGQCLLGQEVNIRMKELGGTENKDLEFDPTMLKFVLEDMATEYGCDLLYYTTAIETIVKDSNIEYIVVSNKDGITAYKAKYFIDCTGDADVAVMSGVNYESGDCNNVNQPVSLRFEMANIDFNKFHAFMKKLGNNANKYFAMNTAGMEEILQKACDENVLTKQDITYFQGFGVPGKPNAMNFNCPELTTKKNVVDAKFLSQKQIEGKKAILRFRNFLIKYIKGFENAYITEIATMVGLRESRRIKALYTMTIDDILNYKKFDDTILSNKYPVDVHGGSDVTLGLKYNDSVTKEGQYWQVPFRIMIAKEVNNLLVAGRCAGFDFQAQSAIRVQLVCRAMGEAAGIGCAIANADKKTFSKIDLTKVSKRMTEKNI